jgi:hypothetical protein
VGLISLIHNGGASKKMLSLRYSSLPAFFVSSFYELRLATLETINAARLWRTAFICGESEINFIDPQWGSQQKNAVAPLLFANGIFCVQLLRAKARNA